MSTVIRLSRGGAKKRPFYRIVVADKRAPRDGDFIERLGTFNPMLAIEEGKRVELNAERASHWLKVGAQPSDRVTKILADAGLVAKPDFSKAPMKTRKKADKLSRAEKRAAAEAEAKEQAAQAAAAPAEEAPAVEAVTEESPAA